MMAGRLLGVALVLALVAIVSCQNQLLLSSGEDTFGEIKQGSIMSRKGVPQITEELDLTGSKGYGERLANAMLGFVVGVILFFLSFPFLYLVESESLAFRYMFNRAKKACSVTIDCNKPEFVAWQDRMVMVYVTGRMTTAKGQQDDELGFTPSHPEGKAVVLIRKVEVLQWIEHKEDNQYSYTLEWVMHEQESSGYTEKETHSNPPRAKKLETSIITNAKVALGAFVLNANVLTKLTAGRQCDLSTAPLPEGFQLVDKAWLHGDENTAGSVRVSYQMILEGEVSICAVQTGNSFRRFLMDLDGNTSALLARIEKRKEEGAGYVPVGWDPEPEKPVELGCCGCGFVMAVVGAVFPHSILLVAQGKHTKEELFSREV